MARSCKAPRRVADMITCAALVTGYLALGRLGIYLGVPIAFPALLARLRYLGDGYPGPRWRPPRREPGRVGASLVEVGFHAFAVSVAERRPVQAGRFTARAANPEISNSLTRRISTRGDALHR